MTTAISLLAQHARERGDHAAVRHKQRGVWHTRTWSELAAEVAQLAASLAQRGVQPGERVALFAQLDPSALCVLLAATQLGAQVVIVDGIDREVARDLRSQTRSPLRAIFVQDAVTLASLGELPDVLTLSANSSPRVRSVTYAELLADPAPAASAPTHDASWSLVQRELFDDAPPSLIALSAEELIQEAQERVQAHALHDDQEAFVSTHVSLSLFVEQQLLSWLLAGHALGFAERATTVHYDRRELGPALVTGTARDYSQLHERVSENLPSLGSWQRRLVDWALGPDASTAASLSPWRLLRYWFIVRPLRDVIGFSRVRTALVVGPTPERSVFEFFARLGIRLQKFADTSAVRELPVSSGAAELLGPVSRSRLP